MDPAGPARQIVEPSSDHVAAINRRRHVVVNFDAIHGDPNFLSEPIAELVKRRLSFADDPDTQIDSIWWNWSEGNQAPYPSQILPLIEHPRFGQWVEDGVDIVKIFLEETHERGIESFFSHRMNGSDNELHLNNVGAEPRARGAPKIPLKEEHPDWLFHLPWGINGYWNFALEGVQAYVVQLLREVAENYDFDGIELDYARGTVLPPGEQWRNSSQTTKFMRSVRAMLQQVARERGRPFLLAARVPENLVGCHLDGLHVEQWARENLVDIFVLGCRSFEVDLPAFRRITTGTPIKLYPAIDDHHSSDGYRYPPIEIFRGVFSNWYRQGADGVQTFNFAYSLDANLSHGGAGNLAPSTVHLQAYRELANPQDLGRKDKTFVVQRRGGGHGPRVVPNPEDWSTPRYKYANTNMFAQLPATLSNDGKTDTLLTIHVGDDVNIPDAPLKSVRLRLLVNDPAAKEAQPERKLERALIRQYGNDSLYNNPPLQDAEIQIRLNGALLSQPALDGGWIVVEPDSSLFAIGANLVGILVTGRPANAAPMTIEKLELALAYN